MRTRVSKGWIRLGVALSAAWVIGVVAYAVYDFRTTERTAISELKFPDPKLPPGWQLVGPETLLVSCSADAGVASCYPRYLNVFLVVLGPVAGAWVLAAMVVYAISWIRAGFRDDEA